MASIAHEANFDGLVGPTHNYAGLAFGNLAATENAEMVANPKAAAKQGLAKMRTVRDLGLLQGVLPPHARPYLPALKAAGFTGGDEDILAATLKADPLLLRNAMSASSMWTANAATVAPSADTGDGRVHFTPANLVCNLHRSFEPPTTSRILKAIFANEDRFAHHAPLHPQDDFGDEGAANHNRFCADFGDPGVQLFVYGKRASDEAAKGPKAFPARQTQEASAAIARLHGLDAARTLYVRQSPAAIDAGAFHNDVMAVANRNVFLYHEQAFNDPGTLQDDLRRTAPEIDFEFIEVSAEVVSLEDTVKSYLFNSQLVSLPNGGTTLILPEEARENENTRAFVDQATGQMTGSNSAITGAHYLDVRESMRNGGGPACLRLRVVLTEAEQAAIAAGPANVFLDDDLFATLDGWIERHYRDRLAPDDLADPLLMRESFTALDELTQIMGLGPVYFFQR